MRGFVAWGSGGPNPPDLNPNFGTELVSDPYQLTEFLVIGTPGPQRGQAARSTGWREPAVPDSAARHNAAPRVRLLQGGIRLSRELSGEEPEVQRLSRHASAAAARTRARRRRAAEWSRNARQLDGSETAGGWRTAGKPIYGSSPAGNDGDAAADASHGSSSTRRRSGAHGPRGAPARHKQRHLILACFIYSQVDR